MDAMKSEEERVTSKDHELKSKVAADENKIEDLEVKSATKKHKGVSTKKFRAVKEGLKHKLRVEVRKATRIEQRQEAQLEKAKNKASKAQEELKTKEAGVSPAEYAKVLGQLKAEKEKETALKENFKTQLADQAATDSAKLKKTKEEAKTAKKELATKAMAKLIEAKGLKAAEDSNGLARRRSSDTKMNKLLNKIQSPQPIKPTEDIIPANMEEALENKSTGADISALKEQLAEKLKQRDIGNIEKGRAASAKEEIEKIQSKLAYKKAALAAIAAAKASSKESEAKSKMRQLTAKQTLAKVASAGLQAQATKLKNQLAAEQSPKVAKAIRKALDVTNKKYTIAHEKSSKAEVATTTQMDRVKVAGEKKIMLEKQAAADKVAMAQTVAGVREAKILQAKVDIAKSEETVKNARAGRAKTLAALEKALTDNTEKGKAKAAALKQLLARVDGIIATARTSLENTRKTLVQDMAAHVRANANTKLYTAEMQTVGQNVKNKLKAQMNKLVESTKNELKVASSNGASTSAIKVEGSKPKKETENEITTVMKDNKGKSPDDIRKILKTKLKAMLQQKIGALKAMLQQKIG